MTHSPYKAEVTLPSDHEVLVTRAFNAPRDLIYKAYTTPELLQKWMLGPPGWTMPFCEMDLRVGGRFHWRWRNDEKNQEFGFHGEFRVVEAPQRIVHTEYFEPGTQDAEMGGALVTIELTEKAGVTMLSTLIDYGSKEARDGALAAGMTDGMEMTYQQLEQMLGEL